MLNVFAKDRNFNASKRKAMIRISPPHVEHSRGGTLSMRANNSAQA
jgi:hypothetical protein